jgi:putative mRNA 3-end processing factor
MTSAHGDDDLVVLRPEGLYCPAGDFYIDPWRPVPMAVVTHAHADHLRSGHTRYLTSSAGQGVVRARVGDVPLQTLPYGESLMHQGVEISLHPAGHVLGSAQVRLAHRGRVWVASGDYKTEPDITCQAFEPVTCDVFITESTFGLPVFRWQRSSLVYAQINRWWTANASVGRCSVLYAYSFGKAQRLLAGIDASIGPVVAHSAMNALNEAYRNSGVPLPATLGALEARPEDLKRALVLAPPSVQGATYLKRFGDYSDAFASGWMQLRGARRRRALDQGFVMSDHADWPGLLAAIQSTQAQRVIVTHGYVEPLVRYLSEQGLQAEAFKTEYGALDDDTTTDTNTDTKAKAKAKAKAEPGMAAAAEAGTEPVP